jgi:hypothetical protein
MTHKHETLETYPPKDIKIGFNANIPNKIILGVFALIVSVVGGSASNISNVFLKSELSPKAQVVATPECKAEVEKLRDRIDALERAIAISIARSDLLVEYLPAPIKKKTAIRKE